MTPAADNPYHSDKAFLQKPTRPQHHPFPIGRGHQIQPVSHSLCDSHGFTWCIQLLAVLLICTQLNVLLLYQRVDFPWTKVVQEDLGGIANETIASPLWDASPSSAALATTSGFFMWKWFFPSIGLNKHYPTPLFAGGKDGEHDIIRSENYSMVEYFQQTAYDRIKKLVNQKSIISWERTHDKFFEELTLTAILDLYNVSVVKLHGRPRSEKNSIWNDTKSTSHFLWEGNLCLAARSFHRTGGVKPHVLFTYMNENRGAFSMDVAGNKTAAWNHLATHWTSWGCSDEEIWSYLDHPNTKAVYTTQHQSFDHHKVHSIPLGVSLLLKPIILRYIKSPREPRSQLLMINDNGWKHRADVAKQVICNFQESTRRDTLRNTYSTKVGGRLEYVKELRRSKFILAPSGLGWDSYRIWEALVMGTVPIIEYYDRPVDRWREALSSLPVLWVNHFHEVTPERLEKEYVKIAGLTDNYCFEKLTMDWWVDAFLSHFKD